MGKRSKGVDAVISKNMLKKSMLSSCKKYAEQLEKENFALKNDPGTVIGQFIAQFRELYSQNQRLSTLTACLITKVVAYQPDEAGVKLTKEEMESYNGKRINIKWEVAEGETAETAKEFTFTYELQDAPPQGQPVQATEQPGQAVMADHDCDDPNCNLPKDLKHRHGVAPAVAEEAPSDPEAETVTLEESAATE